MQVIYLRIVQNLFNVNLHITNKHINAKIVTIVFHQQQGNNLESIVLIQMEHLELICFFLVVLCNQLPINYNNLFEH